VAQQEEKRQTGPLPHEETGDGLADVEWPQPSVWPLALAASVVIVLVGMLITPLMVVAGLVLSLACAVAWGVQGGHK
jgi:hypothetical protein